MPPEAIALVKVAFSNAFGSDITTKLIAYFLDGKQKLFFGDWENSCVKFGKFSEVVLIALNYKNTGQVIQKVDLDTIVRELEQSPKGKLHDSLRLYIPRAIRAIYDIRSNRDAAHQSLYFDANHSDAIYVAGVATWIFVELFRLFSGLSPSDAELCAENILEKELPFVERIGEDLVVYEKDALSHFLAMLYVSSGGLEKKYVNAQLGRYFSAGRLTQVQSEAEQDKLVILQGKTYKLTSLGRKTVEENLRKQKKQA